MSDYASAITEPFWWRDMLDVHQLLMAAGWTETVGEKGNVAFATVIRDLSETGIAGQIGSLLVELAEHLPREADFMISVIYDSGRRESLSAKAEVERADFHHRIYEADGEAQRAMAERAERDRQGNEGSTNPDLEAFLR